MRLFKKMHEADALGTVLLSAQYFGLDCNQRWSLMKQLAYYGYATIVFSLVSVPMYFELSDAYRHFVKKEYKVVFQIIGIVSNAFGYIFIVYSYFTQKMDFLELVKLIRAAAHKSFTYTPKIAQEIHASQDRIAKRFFLCSMFAYEAMYISWCSPPVIYFLMRYPNVNYSTLPLTYGTQNYGLDQSTSSNFWLIIIIQFVHGTATLSGIVFGNMLTPILCILLGCQVNILKASLEKVTFTARANTNFKRKLTFDLPDYYSCERLDPSQSKEINRLKQKADLHDDEFMTHCVQHHQLILRIICKMKPILAPCLFVVLMTSLISVTNLMITMTMFESDVFATTVIIMTGILFTGLLITMTWCLTALRRKLISVSNALLRASWLNLLDNPKRKQDYLIITDITNKQIKFPLLMYSDLDFPRLYQLLNLAWNYYSLVKNMSPKLKA